MRTREDNFGHFDCKVSYFVRVSFVPKIILSFFVVARSAFGFPAPLPPFGPILWPKLELKQILLFSEKPLIMGLNWDFSEKNRMPVWCSRLNDARGHLCTSYMQAFFATPGQVRGTQSKKGKTLGSFRISLKSDAQPSCGTPTPGNMRFHHIFWKIVKNVSKISIFGIFSEKIFRNRTVILIFSGHVRRFFVVAHSSLN